MPGRHADVRGRRTARHRRPPRHSRVLLPTLAAAAVVGVGGVSAGAALSAAHDSGGDVRLPPVVPGLVVGPVSPPAPSPSAPAWAGAAAPGPAGASAGVVPRPSLPGFAVTVTGKVAWVRVLGPRGRVLFEGMLRHGRTISYPQRPLRVTIGDAGAVRLVLRHHAYAPAGRRGAILRFTVR